MKNARHSNAASSANEQSNSTEPNQLELLAPLEFRPGWPALGTLAADALARLLIGERLTQPAFGTHRWRLAAYIQTLKDMGWPVKSTPIRFPGRKRPIAEYWLESHIIMAAREDRA